MTLAVRFLPLVLWRDGCSGLLFNLFRSTARVSQKRELVILIRPTVILSNGDWSQDMLDSRRRIQDLAPQASARFD